jgi:hypothetical protein
MKHKYIFLLIILALAVGTFGGFFFGKSNAFADTAFWSGIASGNVVSTDTIMEPAQELILISPESIGKAVYPNGMAFDLKELKVGEETSLVLYVRNNTKKITNIYTLVSASDNLNIQTPISNTRMYPNGWAQFVFQIKALSIGPCSMNIRFVKSEY